MTDDHKHEQECLDPDQFTTLFASLDLHTVRHYRLENGLQNRQFYISL